MPDQTLADAIRTAASNGFTVSFNDAWPDLGRREVIVVRCSTESNSRVFRCSALVDADGQHRLSLDCLLSRAVAGNISAIRKEMKNA